MTNTRLHYALAFCAMLFNFSVSVAQSSDYSIEKDIFYRQENEDEAYSDTCIKSKCKLDVYAQKGRKAQSTFIFFHGGGLTLGDKYFPGKMLNKNINVICPNYRLSPFSKCSSYLEDCAASVAWTYKHIKEYGGDPKKIYLCGSSSGAYLATMIFLDKHYLAKYNIDPDSLGGLFSFSGQMTTHYTICNERGFNVGSDTKIIDEFAPLYHVRKTTKPMYFFIGDSTMDMPGRYVQNRLIVDLLKEQGNDEVFFRELKNTDHNSMNDPAMDSAIYSLRRIISSIDTNKIGKLTISPNPVRHGSFKIGSDEDIINLNFFNDVGRLTKVITKVSNPTIDVRDLKKGTYIVEGKTKNRSFRQKILIL